MEHGAFDLIDQRAIAPPATDMASLRNGRTGLRGLVGRRPKGSPDVHGCELTIGTLTDVRHAGLLVLLREPGIEHPAEVDVAGVAPGRDDDALPGLDVQSSALAGDRYSQHLPRRGLFADDARHFVTQKDFGTLFPGALRQSPDEARTVASATGRDKFAGNVPFDRDEGPGHSRSPLRTDRPFDELHAIFDQKVVGRDILVGKHADKVSIAILGLAGIVAHPILEYLVGRILDAKLFLQGMPAAEMDPAAA